MKTKNKKNNIKYGALFFAGVLLTFLFWKYPAPHDRILNIQNYLITVGGIISAFVIAYLSAKIFNIKTDRENRQAHIDNLAERLTAFRQLLFFVMRSRDFWVQFDDISKFKKEYPGMNYERLRSSGDDKMRYKFHLEETEISQSTIGLYTAMEAIYNQEEEYFVPWAYDRTVTERYEIEDLTKYHEPCNQIWYYLDGRYAKHGLGHFNDEGLNRLDNENFQERLSIADARYKGNDFHRLILANLGSEFYEVVIPKMIELIRLNSGVPKGLMKTFYSLLAIMTFGVIFPLILQSISVSEFVDSRFTLVFVNLTTLSLINFLFEFFDLFYDEIHTNKKQ